MSSILYLNKYMFFVENSFDVVYLDKIFFKTAFNMIRETDISHNMKEI